jgi:hydrogenase-1 operon protein HyaF
VPNVWWIKFFNSQDALILSTIEVVDVPEIALAAPEDFADTCVRLREIVALFA